MSAPTALRAPTAPSAAPCRALRFLVVPTVLALLLSGRPAGSQELTGALAGSVRDPDGEALAGAVVAVGPRSVSTHSDGRFRMAGLPAGAVVVTVKRLGYQMRTFPAIVESDAAQVKSIDVVLHPVPTGLTPVTVQARRDARELQLTGFYDRQRAGIGRFITRDQIEKRRASSFMELLRSMVPGMQLTGTGRTPNRTVQLRNRPCAPLVVLDGFPMYGAGFDLTSVNPVTVLGVEIYSGPATVPAKFRSFKNGEGCGVIAIWFGVSKSNVMRSPTAAEFAYADSAAPVSETLPVYGAHEVDQPARVDTANLEEPIYPDTLFSREVGGEVLAQFVVDVSGFVLPNSIHTESASHPAFSESVLRALAISRFLPARRNGTPVRQVMVLPFRFVPRDQQAGGQARPNGS